MSGAGPCRRQLRQHLFSRWQRLSSIRRWTLTAFPVLGDYGNAFLKLSTSGNQLAVADYFEMHDGAQQNDADTDLGSGGVLVLPDLDDGLGHTMHLAIGAGKDNNLYVVNRDSMGKFDPQVNNIYQELDGALPGGVLATPAYFNQKVYFGPRGSPILAFAITNAKLSTTATAQAAIALVILERHPASRRMASTMLSFGLWRIVLRPCCTLTMRP